MRRILLILLPLVLIASTTYAANSHSHAEHHGLKGTVKRIDIHIQLRACGSQKARTRFKWKQLQFRHDGFLSKAITYKNNVKIKRYVYHYDKAGIPTRIDYYDKSGKLYSTATLSYSADKKTETRVYRRDGKIISKKTAHFDAEGWAIRTTEHTETDTRIKDADKTLARDDRGRLTSSTRKYSAHPPGLLNSLLSSGERRDSLRVKNYQYNPDGTLAATRTTYTVNSTTHYRRSSYTLDKNGNWIERKIYFVESEKDTSGKLCRILTREISYYR